MDDRVNDIASKMMDKAADKNDLQVLTSHAMAKVIYDMLNVFIEPVNPDDFQFQVAPIKDGKEYELVVHITDAHCGKKTASYSTEVLKERLKTVFTEVYDVTSKFSKNLIRINRLRVLLGGDLVDGDNLYPGHAHFVDSAVYKQIGEMATELTQFLIGLNQIIPIIEVSHVPGNHGRVSKHTHTKNNWDLLMYMLLQANLKNFETIKFHPGEEWYTIVETIHEPIMLTHGDGINMYQSIPLYGMIQSLMRWNGSIKEDFTYIMIGHFHVPMYMQWSFQHLYVNGCFTSDDDWALKLLKLQTPPQQRLLVFSSEGIEFEKMIRL